MRPVSTRLIAAMLALVACGAAGRGWHSVEVSELPENTQRLFVVTTGHAYLLNDASTSSGAVFGNLVTEWRFEPQGAFRVRVEDSPTEIAERYGWTVFPRATTQIDVSLDSVRYASLEDRTFGAKAGSGFLTLLLELLGG